ncbi:MAG: SDR family NAD(P)-dependent oxidoreductase [Anaerolineae bacterium]|nr:SDR family NAD(P)-dependent oxidoreductase [Anaerolineae bacterium]
MTPTSSTAHNKAVLVTGCSSGIGRATALYLAQQGFTVFATVRKESDAQNLRDLGIATLIPVCPLDLSHKETIAPALDFIRGELSQRPDLKLYAIVNNAGGGGVAPIELMDLDRFRLDVEARLVGPLALLQDLLPLIREAHGRVIWIATPAIIPIPFVAGIHACDFAVNCLARTLQIELKRWNIPNILVRCGGVKTAAPARGARELEEDFQQWPRERFELYAGTLRKEQAELSQFDARRSEPNVIAEVVYRALVAEKPRRRYQIGYMSGVASALEYLPQPLVDWIMERRAQ